ncbi:hypothetical protein Nepgr_008836 [Nepenthes gracilis]|uniref:FLZ-type domain-containing protein n=1 Tax=Nepenthes gracilis TaxID=150966 RepID=A0AAD3SAB1_NEPGR|nr:hypothetical protein Nepgr_008836 [Nepenthes gracilis]
MLRKRARSIHKEQQMGLMKSDRRSESYLQYDFSGQKQKTNSFFNVPVVFAGLIPKFVSDCDSVTSPTSPLDFKLLSNLGNSFRYPKSFNEGHLKSWDCDKVGLSIVDSLEDVEGKFSGKVLGSSGSKNILFGPQIRTKTPISSSHFNLWGTPSPKSLPENCAIFHRNDTKSLNLQKRNSDVLFEIGEDPWELDRLGKIQSFSLDSKGLESRIFSLPEQKVNSCGSKSYCLENVSAEADSASKLDRRSDNLNDCRENKLSSIHVLIGSSSGFIGSLSASEIELSEDYTCVISHGPNRKTTHIFGDCILECHTDEEDSGNKKGSEEIAMPKLQSRLGSLASYPSDDFLSFCHFCKKKLEEGNDIYMYRGEKAFCSLDCRLEEISIDEGKHKLIRENSESRNREEIFDTGMFFAV